MSTPDPEWVAIRQQILTAEAAASPDTAHIHELEDQLFDRYVQLGRGGITPGGLPYPDPTDPVAEGADAIRALAEAIQVGMMPIVPTSTATGSGAARISPAGKVSWTLEQSSSAIFINGVFSLAFTRYLVLLNTLGVNDAGGAGTTNTDLYLHFTTGGVQIPGNNYFGGANGNAQAAWQLGANGGHGRTLSWTVINPFRALTTKGYVNASSWDSTSGAIGYIGRGLGHSSPTASFDGFSVDFNLPNGRAGGEVQVFGYLE